MSSPLLAYDAPSDLSAAALIDAENIKSVAISGHIDKGLRSDRRARFFHRGVAAAIAPSHKAEHHMIARFPKHTFAD